MILAGASDLQAQKRRSKAKKRTTTTAAAAKPLKQQDLAGSKYICFIDFNPAEGLQMESELSLLMSQAVLDFGFTSLDDLSWSVSGNTLKVNGDMSLTVTLTNGGKTFKGKSKNSNGKIADCVLYNATEDSSVTPSEIQKMLTGGKYYSYLTIYRRGEPETGFPVNLKITPGADGKEGTYKITGDNKVMTALGLLKGTYTFGDSTFGYTTPSGKSNEINYDKMTGYILCPLGKINIQGLGQVDLELYILRK